MESIIQPFSDIVPELSTRKTISADKTMFGIKIKKTLISINKKKIVMKLSKNLKQNPNLKFYLKQNCETLKDAPSFNVVGEIKGSETPENIFVVGFAFFVINLYRFF